MTQALAIDLACAQLRRTLRGLQHPPLGQATALAEECGEVAKLLLDRHAYGKPLSKADLAGELADVFVCLAEIAGAHGVKLGHAVQAKIADLAQRAPQWRKELSSALETARSQSQLAGSALLSDAARKRARGVSRIEKRAAANRQATTAAGRRSKSK